MKKISPPMNSILLMNLFIKKMTVLFSLILLAVIAKGDIAEGRYYIQLANGRSLEAESHNFKVNGARTQIWLLYHGLNQLWEIRRVPGETGRYYILNVGGNRALDADVSRVNINGCRVQLWQHVPGSSNQKWIIQPRTGGGYTLRCAASATDKVLDVTGAVIDRGGAAIQLSDNLNAPNQLWQFTPSRDSAIVRENFVDLRLNQTTLKNQAPVVDRGGCTYFAAIAVLEAAYKKRGYGELDLSEEFFSIASKVMYLEPYWSRVTGSNKRENQFGGTQGGGSIFWFTNGLRVPLESDVPFNLSPIPIASFTDDQRVVSDYNARLMTNNALKARLYYGAVAGVEFTPAQYNDPNEYERLLNMGYEIEVRINNGEHDIVIVGYDKTDPAHPDFFIKDSYNTPPGRRCASFENRLSYTSHFASRIRGAHCVTQVSEPSSFPELAFMGRWKLNFDGHKGILDIYHIPGINYTSSDFGGALRATEGGAIIPLDGRIGVFYDESGNAFRVNGKIIGTQIEFFFDLATPNQRWDELRGRRFLYRLNPNQDIMTGFHWDSPGSSYGGYATKASAYISHGIVPNRIQSLLTSSWTLMWGNNRGTVTCRFGDEASHIDGTYTYGTITQPFSIWYDPTDRTTIYLRVADQTLSAKFLNHEQGIIIGYGGYYETVLLYKNP